MINSISNQKGIALVTTLMLLVLGFAVVAILFRLTTQETKLARLEQGYTTALDAAKAGADLFIYMAQNCAQSPTHSCGNPPLVAGVAGTPFGTSYLGGQCLQIKLFNATSTWSTTAGWSTAPGCPSQANATNSDPTIYDITFTLSNGATPYKVYVKVIDTWATQKTGSTPCNNGCYYYTVLTRAQAPGGSGPHADIQFVYRYDQ
ncbi:MAG: hypothetical protein ABSG91_07890 [Syntrophobacteraceae bacterium]|jgi:Tfp pilus assembly protein PilX